jgi:hypothetical protein
VKVPLVTARVGWAKKVYCQTPDLPNSQVQPSIEKSGRLYIWVVVCCLLLFVRRNAGRNAGYNRLIPF